MVAGAKHHRELAVWQLGDEIRTEVFRLTSRPAFRREVRERAQINDAANSICRNVAEGFSAGSDRWFAHYLKISLGSLNELMDGLHSAQKQGLVSSADLAPIRALARREFKALGRLIAYLRGDDNGPSRKPRRK